MIVLFLLILCDKTWSQGLISPFHTLMMPSGLLNPALRLVETANNAEDGLGHQWPPAASISLVNKDPRTFVPKFSKQGTEAVSLGLEDGGHKVSEDQARINEEVVVGQRAQQSGTLDIRPRRQDRPQTRQQETNGPVIEELPPSNSRSLVIITILN